MRGIVIVIDLNSSRTFQASVPSESPLDIPRVRRAQTTNETSLFAEHNFHEAIIP